MEGFDLVINRAQQRLVSVAYASLEERRENGCVPDCLTDDLARLNSIIDTLTFASPSLSYESLQLINDSINQMGDQSELPYLPLDMSIFDSIIFFQKPTQGQVSWNTLRDKPTSFPSTIALIPTLADKLAALGKLYLGTWKAGMEIPVDGMVLFQKELYASVRTEKFVSNTDPVQAGNTYFELVGEDRFTPITQNAFGTHPAFQTQKALNEYLLGKVTATVNTTPAAPTVTADDNANTLSATHTLGTSEIVVSENGGAYVAYTGPITVGDVARAAGYWKFKVKSATGRNESAVANSPAFTVTPLPALSLSTTQSNVTTNGGTDGSITATGSGGTGSYQFRKDPLEPWSVAGTSYTFNSLPAGSYTIEMRDAGNTSSSTTKTVTLTQPANTTPAAPTVTADDTANTLSASHALGTSEILVSENNGAYTAYAGQISVGDVARAAGYWKFKTKAATGRNESAVANSPAFTAAPTFNRTLTTTQNADGVEFTGLAGMQFKFNAPPTGSGSLPVTTLLYAGATQIGQVVFDSAYAGQQFAVVYNGTTYYKNFASQDGNLNIQA